jgi:hypothetical protein
MSGIVGNIGQKSGIMSQAAIEKSELSLATAPVNPQVGQMWFNTVTGITYLRVVEGTNYFWMEISGGEKADFIKAGGTAHVSQTLADSAIGGVTFRVGDIYLQTKASGEEVLWTLVDATGSANVWTKNIRGGDSGGIISWELSGSTYYQIHTYHASGVFFSDTSITAALYVIGGGGGGGAHGSPTTSGGGGGGGFVHSAAATVTAISHTVTVGAGGLGAAAGGTSSFVGGSLNLVAGGGAVGLVNTGPAAAGGTASGGATYNDAGGAGGIYVVNDTLGTAGAAGAGSRAPGGGGSGSNGPINAGLLLTGLSGTGGAGNATYYTGGGGSGGSDTDGALCPVTRIAPGGAGYYKGGKGGGLESTTHEPGFGPVGGAYGTFGDRQVSGGGGGSYGGGGGGAGGDEPAASYSSGGQGGGGAVIVKHAIT